MNRRMFVGQTVSSGMFLSGAAAASTPEEFTAHGDLVIERPNAGEPHRGKVLVAVQPHADDIPLFAAGTVAKLLNEGYVGY
ncbi:MAG: hypothetical protein ACREMY_28930, partial [bacterium]